MHKYISSLEKQLMLEQLSEYESLYHLTRQERLQLHRWVRNGNDINSNPWNYECGDGWKLDFICALRMDAEIYETRKRMAEES